MQTKFNVKLHTDLCYGDNSLQSLLESLPGDYKNPVVFFDKNVADNNIYVAQFISSFSAKYGNSKIEFDEPFEPTYQYLERERNRFGDGKNKKFDCIIAIGGGSCIDAAKGFATLATNPKSAKEYRGFPQNLDPSIPIIAVPSTAGTGTELAYNAVFIDLDEGKKLGINTENNYPVLAILDPKVVAGAPKAVIASSGLDALVHTLESFVSVKSSEFTRVFSFYAFEYIINHLQNFYNHPDDLYAAGKMQMAAYYAMVALSNSSAGPSGALSYLIGTKYNVNHGIAGAIFIGKVTRFNHLKGFDYSPLFPALQIDSSLYGSKIDKSLKVVEEIEKLISNLGVPDSLTGLNISQNDFIELVEFADTNYKGAFAFNPCEFTVEDIQQHLIK
jgi:alcohol dehydrogenase class IV